MSNLEEVKGQMNLPAEMMEEFQAAAMSEAVDSSDVQIAGVQLCQAMSEAVSDGEAKPGDIIHSVSKEKLADAKKELEIIPISMKKKWSIYVNGDWDRTEDFTPANANYAYEAEVDGNHEKRVQVMEYYVLTPELVEQKGLPMIIRFRSTSYKAGKVIESERIRLQGAKMPIFAKKFKISSEQKQSDKHKYFVFKVTHGEASSVDEMHYAFEWFKNIKNNEHKVDESDLQGDANY